MADEYDRLMRELATQRARHRDLVRAIDQHQPQPRRARPMVVQIVQKTAIPTTTGVYFAAQQVLPGGTEGEGLTPTFTVLPGIFYVLVLGTMVPAIGDRAIAWPIGGRWVVRRTGGGVACGDSPGTICAIVNDGCFPQGPVIGATITVQDTATPPNTIGTCTTTGLVNSISLSYAGSGLTNGTGYALGFSGGAGSGAAGTFDVVGGQVTNIHLTSGGSGYTSAPAVSFAAAGGVLDPSATAVLLGKCCISVPKSGRYKVICQLGSGDPQSTIVYVTCGAAVYANITYGAASLGSLWFKLTDCDGYKAGGTLVVTGPANFTLTSRGDGAPAVQMCPFGSYTGVVTYPGSSLTETISFTITACQTTLVAPIYTNRITLCAAYSSVGCPPGAVAVALTDTTSGVTVATGTGSFVSGPDSCFPFLTCNAIMTLTLPFGAIPSTTTVNVTYTCPTNSGTDHLGPYDIGCNILSQANALECS